MQQILVLKNARIISTKQIIDNGFVKIINQRIVEIGVGNFTERLQSNYQVIDCQQKNLLPGFIDIHVHGGYGYQFLNQEIPLTKSLNQFSLAVAAEGVTKYCAATVTTTKAQLDNFFQQLGQYFQKPQPKSQAQLLGAYLEGPFIAKDYKGAHATELIVPPNLAWVKSWQAMSNQRLKFVTFAPECDLAKDSETENFVKSLLASQIIPSVGHSGASWQLIQQTFQRGLRHATHLYNGMSPFGHRQPGCVAAILSEKLIDAELICDGIHVDLNIVKFTYQVKGADHLIMISDAMVAKGCPDGRYKLGPLAVIKKGLKVTLASNHETIAGSVATMIAGFKNLLVATDYQWQDCVKMTSYNAAKKLKIADQTGDIVVGHLADLILIDDKYELVLTICEGTIAFQT